MSSQETDPRNVGPAEALVGGTEVDLEAAGIHAWEVDLRRQTVDGRSLPGLGDRQTLSTWLETIHPSDRPNVTRSIEQQIIDPSRSFSVRFRRLSVDGELRWYLAQARCRDGYRLRGAVVDLGLDPTFGALPPDFSTASVLDRTGAVTVDREGRTLDATGSRCAESVDFAASLAPPARSAFRDALRLVFEKGDATSFAATPDGRSVLLLVAPVRRGTEVTAAVVLEVRSKDRSSFDLALGPWTDIVLSNFRDIVYVSGVPGRKVLYVSPEFPHLSGHELQAIYQDLRAWLHVFHPDDRQLILDSWESSYQPKDFDLEFRIRQKGGRWGWYWLRSRPVLDQSGAVVMRVGVVSDITERRQASLALERTEALYRQITEQFRDALWVGTTDGTLIFTNAVYRRCWSDDLACGRELHWRASVAPGQLEDLLAAWRQFLEGAEFDRTYRVVEESGGRWYRERIRPIRDSNGRIHRLSGIVEDVTAMRWEEDRRREANEAQKAALIREVHHRIKNSLQGLAGLVERWAESSPGLSDISASAISQLQSVAVVHGLQGRRHPNGRSAVTLQELLAAIEEYLRRLTGLELDYDLEGVPPIEIDGSEAIPVALVLNEILLNAVKHGRPEGPVQLSVCLRGAAGTPSSGTVWSGRGHERAALHLSTSGISADSEPAGPGGRCLREAGHSVTLQVRNLGCLPEGFDIDSGVGLGTGLDLARLLIPRTGASLTVVGEGGVVSSTLELASPLISLVLDHTGSRGPTA